MNNLLTVSEVAKTFQVDDTTVRRWIKQGTLKAIVLPHRNARQAYRIKREVINKILDDDTAALDKAS
jgi:excisionase family DNA binding protein